MKEPICIIPYGFLHHSYVFRINLQSEGSVCYNQSHSQMSYMEHKCFSKRQRWNKMLCSVVKSDIVSFYVNCVSTSVMFSVTKRGKSRQ